MTSELQYHTLSSAVDNYLILRGVESKKHFAKYMVGAKWAYKELYWQSQFMNQSKWVEVKAGSPYNYIDFPSDMLLLIGVSEVDRFGNIQELYQNNMMNIIEKPKNRVCECESCGGNNLNDAVNAGFQVVTTYLFSVNGTEYFQKDWIKYTKCGDIVKYSEIPTKKYNDTKGDAPFDYNEDYNNDYSNGMGGFSNFEVVTVKEQSIICHVETKPCGCPVESEENINKIRCSCAAYVGPYYDYVLRKSYEYVGDINTNERGWVKVDDANRRIYFKHSPKIHSYHSKHEEIERNKIPHFLLVNYQTDAENLSGSVVVPANSMLALFAGIDYFVKRYSPKESINVKQLAKYEWENEKDKLILQLNRFSIDQFKQLKDTPIRW